jgi:hypothetical protein
MEKSYMDRLFSAERLARFYAVARQDAIEASLLYAGNIKLSESLYPSLAIAEIVLRNAINRQLKFLFGTPDWYLYLSQDPVLADLQPSIDKAQTYILDRQEALTADKMVAELTFGFWVTLFNRAYEEVLWKQLRLTFAHLPKADRQRATVSVVLNDVRKLRNRVYHNEPICWRLAQLQQQHQKVLQLIGWVEPEALVWLQQLDRFSTVLDSEQRRRATGQVAATQPPAPLQE